MKLHDALDEYLKVRRALGFKLTTPGGLLQRFVTYAEREGASSITTELALRWATGQTKCQPTQWASWLSRQIGLRGPADSHGPRLHDLRHRFAVQTLLVCYRAGLNVEQHLPELSAYLGHAHVNDTYWYISAVPELLQLATLRLEGKEGTRDED
jgi:integrase